jgi:uncharacterized membrane protein
MTISSMPRRTPRTAVALTVVLGTVLVAAGCSGAQDHDTEASATASATATDVEAPAAGRQCAGQSIDDSAAINSSTDILIEAPLDHVWDVQTDVESWDEWQDAVLTVERLDSGDLASDSRFRWTTPVPESDFAPADTLAITSSVQELEPGVCVLWKGPAVGESITIDQGVHLWTFTETDEGTLVHTEESWDAEILDALEGPDHETVAGMLGGGLDIWLQALKNEAEKQA